MFSLKKKNWCLGDVARDDSQNIVATLLGHCFEWLQHCYSIATLCSAKNRSCKSYGYFVGYYPALKLSGIPSFTLIAKDFNINDD